MRDWLPITRGDVIVRGVDVIDHKVLDVSVPLSRVPEEEWRDVFNDPVDLELPPGLREPRLMGSNIEMQPPDDAFEASLRYIDARITETNHRYEIEVIPRLIHHEAIRAREEAERQARVEEARDIGRKP